MLGQLKWAAGSWGGGESGTLYGLPILRTTSDPAGLFPQFRLRRAGKTLWRGGVLRVLTPDDFTDWSVLAEFGLRPVSPEPLVRAKADELALSALHRRDLDPEGSTVALRGNRVDRDMRQAAIRLCPQVRRLIISAPRGGEELSLFLRREFGVPILPPEEEGNLALRFSASAPAPEEGMELFGMCPKLGGLQLLAPRLAEEDRGSLPLLTALWQGGCLRAEQVKIVESLDIP